MVVYIETERLRLRDWEEKDYYLFKNECKSSGKTLFSKSIKL